MTPAPARTASRLGGVLLFAALLAGCASPDACDPSRTNIFTAAGCDIGGGASAREAQLTDRAVASEARAQELQAEVQALQAEIDVRRAERRTLTQRAADMDRDLARLRGTLNEARAVQGVNQMQLAALQSRLATFEAQRSASAVPTNREMQRMEREADAMFDEMDALLGVPRQ